MYDTKTLSALRGWAQGIKYNFAPSLTDAFVFGSLVNGSGRAFSPTHSDIDLILVTDEEDPSERLKLLMALRPKVVELEDLLKAAMSRSASEPITSTTVVTKFELEQGIHKDRNSREFFSTAGYLPITYFAECPTQIGGELAHDLLTDFFPAWTAIAIVQGQRNKFLRRTASGGWAFVDFRSDVYVLPKDMLRTAYAVECIAGNKKETFQNVDDIASGIDFVKRALKERKDQTNEADELIRLVESNRPGGKGEIKDVPAALVLYAWELLAICAEAALNARRNFPAVTRSKYAAKEVSEELLRLQSPHLHCVDTAVELYQGPDLVPAPSIPIDVTRRYSRDLYEIVKLDESQLSLLASEWPADVAGHLKARFGNEGSERSECKVGFERLDVSSRGVGQAPKLSVRPLTYWVTRQFNKEIAIHKDTPHRRLRAKYAERLFHTAEDFHCECPSALYLELAVITSDGRIPVLVKASSQSALSVRAGGGVRTCGPEFGFVWAKHVAEADGGYQLRIESALNDALRDEFGVIPSEVASWVVNSLAIESAHLNSALLGVVTLTIPEADLANRLARTLKYHSAVEGFLSKHELLDRVQSDFGKGFWHATGLLRLTLAAQKLKEAVAAPINVS